MGIKINNIHYNAPRTGKHILQGINMSIEENETITFVGPGGSGKTSFLKIISGLIEPASGDVVIDDINLTNSNRQQIYTIKKRMGFVFQNGALISNLNVYDNIALPLRYHTDLSETEIFNKVYSWLEKTELSKNIYDFPAELTTSQKKGIGLIRAVINSPKYIFLDEPTSNMDYHYINRIKQIIKSLKETNTTIIITTNRIKWAADITDRFAVLVEGKVEMCGKYNDICYSKNIKIKETMKYLGGDDVN